jgi:hypothetical protein
VFAGPIQHNKEAAKPAAERSPLLERSAFIAERPQHRTSLAGILQRKCACDDHPGGGGCESCAQKKAAPQRKLAASHRVGLVPPIVEQTLESPGEPLDDRTRLFFEERFRQDFTGVRVHTDPAAVRSAVAVNAQAYTVGSHIVFGPGMYAPRSQQGRGLLAHELAHVIQQGSGADTLKPSALDASETDTHEREAEHARAAIESGADAVDVHLRSGGTLQRLPGSPAGGCGVCYGGPQNAGTAAHDVIQAAFGPRFHPEFPISPSVTDESGELDLAVLTGRDTFDIGEIKPANPQGLLRGDQDLFFYEDQLKKLGFKVKRLTLPPPVRSLDFPTLIPPQMPPNPRCPPTQQLFVDPPVHGIYTYWCMPDYYELRTCSCRRKRDDTEELKKEKEKEETEKVPIPVTPPVTAPQGQPQAPGLQGPAPTGPAPKPATPDKDDGGKVIPFRPGKKPGIEQDQPEEQPLAARERLKPLIWIIGALAASFIGKKLLEQAVKALAGSASKGGPILAVIQVLAVAAVIVLSERQARAGEKPADDDPLVALAQMLDDTGKTMPPEIRKLLEDDPELRELVRLEMERRRRAKAAGHDAAAGGAKPGDGAADQRKESAPGLPGQPVPGATPGGTQKDATPATDQRHMPAGAAGAKSDEGATSGGGPSYWEAAKRALDERESTRPAGNKAQFDIDLAVIPEGQTAVTWAFQRQGDKRAVWLIKLKVLKHSSANTTYEVVWSGGLLLRGVGPDDLQLPPQAPYLPGKRLTTLR